MPTKEFTMYAFNVALSLTAYNNLV